MDLTAAIAAFFQFLSTPAGQTLCTDLLKLDAAFNTKLGDLFNMIHGKTVTPAAAATVKS